MENYFKSHHGYIMRLMVVTLFVLALGVLLSNSPAAAGPLPEVQKPFILPFAEPPGPATWLVAQPYGNTTYAYQQRNVIYRLSGGIHFGTDLAAPCGTEVVAIADGVVFAVDNLNFGSGPHNLMIDHPDLGYASLYGHLLEAPDLKVGQQVKRGEPVALSGDPAETCHGRPHLHLEIRDLTHVRKYNPQALIDADWDNLATIGAFRSTFEYDLDEPRKWQHLDDQPEVTVGGPLVNDFARPWPPDVVLIPMPRVFAVSGRGAGSESPLAASEPALQRLAEGGCCTQPTWSADSRSVLVIDRPNAETPTGIWRYDITENDLEADLFSDRIAFYTADHVYRVVVSADTTTIEQVETGASWTVPARGQPVSISPGQTRIAWQVVNDQDYMIENRVTQIFVANLDGNEAQRVVTIPRGAFAGWISEDAILFSGRESLKADEQIIYSLSLVTGERKELVRGERLRGALPSPDGVWLAYYIAPDEDPMQNGVWVMRTDGSARHRLDISLFGSYRWRDDRRLIILPFRQEAAYHELWEFNVESLAARRLTDPDTTPFKIANDNWCVSPDGQKVAFVESRDRNLWVLTLAD